MSRGTKIVGKASDDLLQDLRIEVAFEDEECEDEESEDEQIEKNCLHPEENENKLDQEEDESILDEE